MIFHPNFNHPWQYFITKMLGLPKYTKPCFDNWRLDELKVDRDDDNNRKLIHKKCHESSYHNDLKYYMTLKTLCNYVVNDMTHKPTNKTNSTIELCPRSSNEWLVVGGDCKQWKGENRPLVTDAPVWAWAITDWTSRLEEKYPSF